jgi:fatty acid desaturase
MRSHLTGGHGDVMTTLTSAPTADTAASAVPRRRTLVALALTILVVIVAIVSTGSNNESDSSMATIKGAYDYSETVLQVTNSAGLVVCALLVFLGVGVRAALRSQRPAWTADVAMLGFTVIGLTIAGWAVSGLAMWHAVDQGEDASIRALNFIDTANFLPLMMGMLCAMVGAGLAGLTSGTLPTWLAICSIALGCLAPLGPLGFIPSLLLPLWLVAVAVTVRVRAKED